MNPTIKIKIKNVTDEIIIITSNIQEVMTIKYGNKYRILLVLVSGRQYYLADDSNNDIFDTKVEAEAVRDSFESLL